MAESVGTYQVPAFTSPVDGETQSAAVVLGNDNTNRVAFNNHDLDSGLHFQSGALASRPAAGSTGRKWFTSDSKRLYYDNGSAWVEADYVGATGAAAITGSLAVSGALTGQIPASSIHSGQIAVARGGTGVDASAAAHGTVLIGNGAGFTLAGLTAGANISITPGAGSITIATLATIKGAGTIGAIPKLLDTDEITDSIMAEDAIGVNVVGQIASIAVALGNSGAAKTIDWSAGNVQAVEINANCTFTFDNPKIGGWYTLVLTGNGVSYNATWPAGVRWSGGVEPDPTPTAGKYTTLMFLYLGSDVYVGFVAGMNA